MLVARREETDRRVVAAYEKRSAGPWVCPGCKAAVVIKKGKQRAHHFAHAASTTCTCGAGETDAHRRAKMAIYEKMRHAPGASKWKLERDLGEIIPDVSGRIDGQWVAVEVQRSTLSIRDIERRTAAYAERDIAVLWVGLWRDELAGKRYAPKAWERWLHALYFGRVFYWKEEARVVLVRFDPYKLWVEQTDFGGGYYRFSKRWRTPTIGRHVDIYKMRRQHRTAWSSKPIDLPASCIWTVS